ncbi:MAG TPA: O-antigen ligase family protein [Candidatus Saccharimonadales bacterium]|nr:O-antigen ligase family protein [Candidatus Saccharimonadales bacterium]
MLKQLFYFCLVLLCLAQFTSVYRSTGSNIYVFDFAVGLFALYGLVIQLNKSKYIIPTYLVGFVIFTFFAFITLIPSFFKLENFELLTSVFYLIRWLLYLLAAINIFNMLKSGEITYEQLVKSILLAGVFVAVTGFIQLVVLPDFEKLDPSLGWDPHKNRLASTFFDPNFVGGFLNICLAFALGYFVEKKQQISKSFLITSISITGLAIFLTFSRSAWAMSALTILIFGMFKSKKLLFAALLIAFLTFFAVPRVQTRISGVTDPADSAHFRLTSWQNALTIAKDNILLGVGFNTFRFAQKDYGFFDAGSLGGNSGAGTDSSFLLILATTGIFGFILFVFSYFWPIIEVFTKKNPFLLTFLSISLGILLQSQFINAIFYPQILFLWLITFSVANYFALRK